jgi:uncharacterized protein YoxC
VFLGVIAVATLAIAIAQIAVIVAAGRVARRLERIADEFEREIKPLFGHLNAIGGDLSRAASLAAVQVDRADKLFADVASRIDKTLNSVQATIDGPARQGRALMSGFRAAIEALRELRQGRARRGRGEDEDALFI